MGPRLLHRLRAGIAVVRPAGWLVGGLGLTAALVAWLTGWRELAVLAAASGCLLLLAGCFLLGRTQVRVDLRLEPIRVVAGDSVAAGVQVTNLARRRLLSTTLEVPVGPQGVAVHRYSLGSLAPGATEEESFTIRTHRRGVIPVGPVLTRRGDPLGLLSRDVAWTPELEVLVRPPLLHLESFGAGLLRDLEGITHDAVSTSDLAFHSLREYVPGDDLRHVHWRSSAKVMAAAGENALLVRQYLDTRRSHACVVVDDRPEAFGGPDDFETALAAAASIAVRALVDEFEVSLVCGSRASIGTDGQAALDAVCRAEPGGAGLVETARGAAVQAPDTSVVFLITGAECAFADLQRAGAAFGPQVRRFAILVDPAGTSRVREVAGLPVLHLKVREDLAALLRWSAS